MLECSKFNSVYMSSIVIMSHKSFASWACEACGSFVCEPLLILVGESEHPFKGTKISKHA
jgi:hypothetical protein